MLKKVCLAIVLAAGMTGAGCVGVIGNTVTVRDDLVARKPVVVDGRIYVVDVRTGKVMALDPEACKSAGSFEAIHRENDGP